MGKSATCTVQALIAVLLSLVGIPECRGDQFFVTVQPGFNLLTVPCFGPPDAYAPNEPNNSIYNWAFFKPDYASHDGDTVLTWNCTGAFSLPVTWYNEGPVAGWYDPWFNSATNLLNPGTGFVFYNALSVPETNTFMGTPIPGPTFPPTNYCGCGQKSLLGNPTTNNANYQQVTGLPPIASAQVMRLGAGQTGLNYPFDPTNLTYTTHTFTNGAWSPSEPILGPLESAFFVVPCGPTLTIAPAGNQFVLMWPTNAGAFALQSTTNPAALSAWGPVTNTTSTVGSLNTVTLPTDGSTRYFRLVSQ